MGYFVDPSPSAGQPGEVHTSQQNDLGAVRKYSDGATYIYLSGVASCAIGSIVVYQPSVFGAVLIASGKKGSVAIATAAVSATTSYGWFMIIGQSGLTTTRTALTSNTALFAGGVAGNVDVAAVKGDQIFGLYCRNAPGAVTTAILQIDRAFIGASNESTG